MILFITDEKYRKESIPVKKKCIICIYIVLLVIFVKLMFNFIYNEVMIAKYNKGSYSSDVSALMVFNWFQPYIVYYNNGNISYQEDNFDMAIEEYAKALAMNPPKYKECSIRINMALAMIGRMGEDFDAPENVDNSIAQLTAAKDVLLTDNFATEEDDGHSKTAEELKEEIEEMIKKLQEQKESASESKDDGEESKEQKSVEDELENNLKQQLQQIQSEAYKDRELESQFMEELTLDMNFDIEGAIW